MSLKETKKIDTNRYQLEITVDGEKFREAIREAYKKNSKKINVPGFRRGKAPLHIIETYYGTEIFFEDALNLLYNDLVDEAITESGLKVINDKMDFEMVSISKEDGADFKVSVTTYPEIEIGDYKGLKAEKTAVKVDAAEVNAEVNAMAERNARMVSVEDRAAQKAAELHADDRQNGDQRVRQRVTPDHDAFLLSLGAGRSDVVRLDDLQHAGAGHASDHGQRAAGQREDRHRHFGERREAGRR